MYTCVICISVQTWCPKSVYKFFNLLTFTKGESFLQVNLRFKFCDFGVTPACAVKCGVKVYVLFGEARVKNINSPNDYDYLVY